MLAKVHSAAVLGIESYPIEIEVNSGWGQPAVIIVGLQAAGETWRGYAKSLRDEEVCVAYSSVMGLTVEKGVKDESDQ